MLTAEMKDRCTRLIEVGFAERRRQLKGEISLIYEKMAARGMGGSGHMISLLHALIQRELEIRGVLIWENIVRVHKVMGSPIFDASPTEFKNEFSLYISKVYEELTPVLKDMVSGAPRCDLLNLDDKLKYIIKKHDVEIDLYVDSLKQLKERGDTAAPQYNFYGNVGAVQTGASSAANVIQNLGQEDRNELITALELVKESLTTIQEIGEARRVELIEIAQECLQQSNTGSPNNTKLMAMLNLLGITVQSFASAQPAYQALKAALIPLGITLP
ncbi:MAG: hypothetical protein JW832_15280 [Deltaproteobacteria bacterium]|nr:hypothetical protein [Deltaproteobacteria bacterium]